jgi:EAL and modified HD-GYP domain-containing signal transduction protein
VTSHTSVHEPSEQAPAPHPGTRFVARQPIFDRGEQVFGYELLFRDGLENLCTADPEGASRSTLDSSLFLGLDVLCGDRYAFVNCTREVLLKDYATLLPPRQTVIEILETVTADPPVIAACERLREAGYLIALDDFAADDPRESLTSLADIIKVDFRATRPEQRAALVKRHGKQLRLLAEKVETRLELQSARALGFVYFQGYFFRKPEVMAARDIPANRLNYLRMLQAVSRPEINLREIETLIKGEVALCYRLLRYLNSAIFCFGSEIRSVRHALSMLGEREIRRWIRLVATIGAGGQKCSEVVVSTLVRARFCELLAPKVQHGGSDLFLMGLMSLMDVILELPMTEVLAKVPIEKAIKAVILGLPSHLRTIYRLMLAEESGEWEAVDELAKLLQLSREEIAAASWQAMQWAREVTAK